MARVFISHSDNDSEFALQLAILLTKLSFEVWLALPKIPADKKLPEIQSAWDQCEAMIAVVSPASMASLHVTNEWQYYFVEEALNGGQQGQGFVA